MLTSAQLLTLKADILADSNFNSQPHNSDGAFAIAAVYNADATPAFVVWKSSVTRDEVQALDAFDWTLVDNLTVGKARIFDWMFMRGVAIDPSKANIRAGIAACFVGSAPLVTMQTAILTSFKRNATRFEKLFATGTGTTVSPAVAVLIGSLDYNDIVAAMGW